MLCQPNCKFGNCIHLSLWLKFAFTKNNPSIEFTQDRRVPEDSIHQNIRTMMVFHFDG